MGVQEVGVLEAVVRRELAQQLAPVVPRQASVGRPPRRRPLVPSPPALLVLPSLPVPSLPAAPVPPPGPLSRNPTCPTGCNPSSICWWRWGWWASSVLLRCRWRRNRRWRWRWRRRVHRRVPVPRRALLLSVASRVLWSALLVLVLVPSQALLRLGPIPAPVAGQQDPERPSIPVLVPVLVRVQPLRRHSLARLEQSRRRRPPPPLVLALSVLPVLAPLEPSLPASLELRPLRLLPVLWHPSCQMQPHHLRLRRCRLGLQCRRCCCPWWQGSRSLPQRRQRHC